MMTVSTYDQCLDRCESAFTAGNARDYCLDRCDERFAGGYEPPAPADWGIAIEATE